MKKVLLCLSIALLVLMMGCTSKDVALDDIKDKLKDTIDFSNFSKEEDISYLASLGIFHEGFLDYLRNFHFEGDIWAIPEGSVVWFTTSRTCS